MRLQARRSMGVAFLLMTCAFLVACGESATRSDVSVGEAYEELQSDDPPIFLDVRSEAEYEQARIEGSIHIPHTEVADRIDELRALGNDEIIVYCERGGRARAAEAALEEAGGFHVRHMEGDMRSWRRSNLPVVRGDG
jgi:rhodanese-related sulfurtransferase